MVFNQLEILKIIYNFFSDFKPGQTQIIKLQLNPFEFANKGFFFTKSAAAGITVIQKGVTKTAQFPAQNFYVSVACTMVVTNIA